MDFKVHIFPSDIIADAQMINIISENSDFKSSDDHLKNSTRELDEERSRHIRNEMFPFIFLNLYLKWFSVERPMAALEILVLDFRDVPLVCYNDHNLLGMVAGIAESLHEDNWERLVSSVRFHHVLYPVAQMFLKHISETN